MTNALVEAVARVLCGYYADKDGEQLTYEEFVNAYWREDVNPATAALQAIEAAGYRVVPVEATDRMSEACWRKASDVSNGKLGADQEMWSAMLSAAPRVGEG